jgi:hypothetical protein
MTDHFFVKPKEFSEQLSELRMKGHNVVLGYMIVAKKEIADMVNSFKRNSKEVFLASLALQKLSTNNCRYEVNVFRNINADCTDVSYDEFYTEFTRLKFFRSYKDFLVNNYNLSMIENNCDYEAKSPEAFWFYWGEIPSGIIPQCRLNISPKNIRSIAEANRIEMFCEIASKRVRLDDSIIDEAGNILADLLAYSSIALRLDSLRGFTIDQYHRIISRSQSMTLKAA